MAEICLNNTDPCLVHNFKGHKKPILSVSFHCDNRQFLSSSSDHSINMWNLDPKNTRCYNLTGHTDIVNCVRYCPNGQLFASCSHDRTVRLWVPSVRGESSYFTAHTAPVRCLAFSPTSDKVILVLKYFTMFIITMKGKGRAIPFAIVMRT